MSVFNKDGGSRTVKGEFGDTFDSPVRGGGASVRGGGGAPVPSPI